LRFIYALILLFLISFKPLSNDSRLEFYGFNLVGTPQPFPIEEYEHVLRTNANSVAIIPFSYGNSATGALKTSSSWQWWGESAKGSKEMATMAKAKGLKVMIKPQVWFDGGTFTGDVRLDSEEKWQKFEQKYEDYILTHAINAESISADIFCIGTELREFINARPEFWGCLINEVKEHYTGKLTYAGNWDSYKYFPYWDLMDFIGVDAYFPLIAEEKFSPEEIKNAWKPWELELEKISSEYGKKVLFTEFGYRSTAKSAHEPWDSKRGGSIDLANQTNAFSGTFKSVWLRDFMAGGFIWKWYPNDSKHGGDNDNRFTPQNKPAEETIKATFLKSKEGG